MKKSLFCVLDLKSQVYGNIFTSVNAATALRDFQSASNDPNSDLCKYPEDFILYELGTYDDAQGLVEIYEVKTHLGNALQFKEA